MKTRGEVGKTVKQELARRKGCRYGLRGVKARALGRPGELYVIEGSHWDRESKLRLDLRPEGSDPDAGYPEETRARLAAAPKGWRPVSTAELLDWKAPEGWLEGVPAEEVVLLSEWPVVCP